ncbi:T-box transcription factor TBX19-like [Synchiropus picturatus]
MSRLLRAVESQLEAGLAKGDPMEKELRVTLEDSDLWRKFQSVTNEMIVTKNGRRMFPVLRMSVSGLDPTSMYSLFLDFPPADGFRWKFINGEWVSAGRAEQHAEGRGDGGVYIHPDSPNFGAHWMKAAVTFNKVKLTNKVNGGGQISLCTLHKYEPHLHIVHVGSRHRLVSNFSFKETQFIAVTAYQNEEITALKIKYNPFAKAFLDAKDRNTCKQGTADPPDGRVRQTCWSLCSAGQVGAFPRDRRLAQHHYGYSGRHSPYPTSYLSHWSHPPVQRVSDGWSSAPPSSSASLTGINPSSQPLHNSSQYPCLWAVGCGEQNTHSPQALCGPMGNEMLLQPAGHFQMGGTSWPPGPAHAI